MLEEDSLLRRMYAKLSNYCMDEMKALVDEWWVLTDKYTLKLFEEYFSDDKASKLMRVF